MENNMVTCKFSKDELNCIAAALKFAANNHLDEMMNIYNDFESHFGDKRNTLDDTRDMMNYIVGLRGNVKSLIRNN